MPSYLIIAYAIFVTFPLVLALSIHVRRRQAERKIEEFQTKT